MTCLAPSSVRDSEPASSQSQDLSGSFTLQEQVKQTLAIATIAINTTEQQELELCSRTGRCSYMMARTTATKLLALDIDHK